MRLQTVFRLLSVGVLLLPTGFADAHEIKPAYLELRETATDTFSVLWKLPKTSGRRLALEPRLPDNCSVGIPLASYPTTDAIVQRWSVECAGGIGGRSISIDGLESTLTDVLVRIERTHAGTQTVRLTPGDPTLLIAESASWRDISKTYLLLGVEHILGGVDHLLFVLALLMIVTGWRKLVMTITAFTVAHSITLAAATLGYVHVPQQPIEAMNAIPASLNYPARFPSARE